jgi:ABC-type uncharacterized transport system permease subunit
MSRTLWTGSVTALLVGSSAAIFAYNLWSYCCGRCTARAFLTIGVPGGILMGLTVAAALLLVLLKTQRRTAQARLHCACGARLGQSWTFCPHCGRSCTDQP